jgi:hypothetical protein
MLKPYVNVVKCLIQKYLLWVLTSGQCLHNYIEQNFC